MIISMRESRCVFNHDAEKSASDPPANRGCIIDFLSEWWWGLAKPPRR
jgi:hypothetical protein